MGGRLRSEEVVTIQVLAEKQVPRRAIARQLGVSEGAVRYRLRRQAEGAEDGRRGKVHLCAELEAVVEQWRQGRTRPDRPINTKELYEHLVEQHGYARSYKSVLRFVRHRYGRPKLRTYRRVETPPGAQAQTDWGIWTDLDLGDGAQRVSAFVMSLSHSRRPAIVWSLREDQVSWLHCHNRAFERLCGIAAVNRIDNPKTAMSQGAGAWGTIHPTYQAYARAVGFHIDACAPRQPQEKGKVEAKVRLCRNLFASLGRRFDGLEDLQAATDARIERWSERAICPATGKSVRESWQEELSTLRPLPILPEPFDVVVARPVNRDGIVHFEQRQYAVPFEFAGRQVEVRGCAGKVQICCEHRVVREYARGTPERILIDPSCYEGPSTDRVQAPPPLGRMGRKLQEIYAMAVEQRPLDLYAALAEVAR